ENSSPEWGLTDFDPEEKNKGMGKIADVARSHFELMDSMVICVFLPGGIPLQPSDFATFLNLATGQDYTSESLQQIGQRIATLHRAFNNRCGITRKDDTLAKRQLSKLKDGGSKDFAPDLPAMLEEFYEVAGWDEEGRPTPETLRSLDLAFAINDLHG
ncbi:MAG: aldehyde ferredoxin oxidoreductase C-terminal domain-containing protein, partial [Chlorobiales bacterium]|nr:aldehyde ferredoxin oxidoreductase C-terminal domain-containing protein [Chlorobiales bacterium]